MKTLLFALSTCLVLCGAALRIATNHNRPPLDPLPYAEAGLTEREAATHLLNRFTFGPRPGDIDRVVNVGLETWLDRQLRADFPEKTLDRRLRPLNALNMPVLEIAKTYPNPGVVQRMAAREENMSREEMANLDRQERRRMLREYMEKKGLRPQRELIGELIGQKVLRGVYSENQLAEVLTDFWFNHFNVTLQDNQARPYVLAYERDAIRPNVLGPFRALLGATAKHPAMLLYLDNAQSTAPDSLQTTMDLRLRPYEQRRGLGGRIARRRIRDGRERLRREQQAREKAVPEQFRPRRGVNENYARELMELHTLGVDGGYTQQDVEEVARAFTGWTVVPPEQRNQRRIDRIRRQGTSMGFVLDNAFLFRADVHDATEKTILGTTFPAGGGIDEGERVLDMVATHPSTAKHLVWKIAVRFVSDEPPQELVDALAEVYLESGGDLRAVIKALAYSPHFWNEDALRAKVKSPYELAVSSLRALNANVRPTRALVEWIDKMGQPLYRYQAPTGFPDEADHWINAGSLLNRMNFGLQLAGGTINGVRFDLLALNDHREPETVEDALEVYLPLLLPEQEVSEAVSMLLPMALDPDLQARLDASSDAQPDDPASGAAASPDPSSLARVVGVILGSPEFQRR
ncbi:MAG: DUF1800 domain-containing protein [Rhodothermales bacterium]